MFYLTHDIVCIFTALNYTLLLNKRLTSWKRGNAASAVHILNLLAFFALVGAFVECCDEFLLGSGFGEELQVARLLRRCALLGVLLGFFLDLVLHLFVFLFAGYKSFVHHLDCAGLVSVFDSESVLASLVCLVMEHRVHQTRPVFSEESLFRRPVLLSFKASIVESWVT